MRAQVTLALTAAVGLVLAACGESRDSVPTSPQFRPEPVTFPCDFATARGLARTYFGQPTQGLMVAKIDAMEGTSDAGIRTANGLDIFATVATGTDVVGTVEDGSDLLNSITACSSLGATGPTDWTGPLGPQGALEVVGDGSANESGPVYSKDAFSAVAPPATKDWSAWLRLPQAAVPPNIPELPDARAVVFGAPFIVTSDLSPEAEVGARGFDWFTLPVRPFPFGNDPNDDGFFGICVSSVGTSRVQNNHGAIQGLLGFPNPTTDPIVDLDCGSFDANGNPIGTNTGLLRRTMDLLIPQPAYAAAALLKSGGTPGGFSKHFLVASTAVRVTFLGNPAVKDAKVGEFLNSSLGGGVKVLVTSLLPSGDPGVPLQRVLVRLDAFTNQGQPANLSGTNPVLTDEFGIATYFNTMTLSSPGGYRLRATPIDGLGGLTPSQGISNQFHIKRR